MEVEGVVKSKRGRKGGIKGISQNPNMIRKRRSDRRIDEEKAFPMLLERGAYRKIGDMFGVSRQAAFQMMNKADIKEKFEDYLKTYLGATLPSALTDSVALVTLDPGVIKDMSLMKLKYDEIDKVMRTAGLRPSESTPIFIQKLQQVNVFENPLVKGVMDQYVKGLVDWKPDGVIEAEEVSS